MKKGWEYKTIKELCEILDSRRKPITKSKREPGNVPYYGATGLLDHVKDYIFNETLVLLGEDGAKWGAGESSAYQIKGKTWVNNHAHVLRPQSDIIDNYWLIYYLNYSDLTPYITGITVPKLNQERMSSIPVPTPPLSEQKEIVNYLDSSFAKIDKLKENAAKNLEEAKALFQSALKKALEPKEGWEEKTLIKEFSLKSGDNLSAKKQIKGPYDVYGGNGVTGSHIEYNLSGKNILIGRVGALCGNIHFVNAKIWVTDNAFIVKDISEHWHMDFLTYELKYLNLNQYASQTAQPVISNKSMKDVMIMLPPLSEQQSIVSFLDSLNEKLNTLQQNYSRICNECDALKQAILRQVFE